VKNRLMFFHSVVCQLNLMIHHKTPASKIKIKCIEKRSHKRIKSESFLILVRLAKTPLLETIGQKGKENLREIFYNTKKQKNSLTQAGAQKQQQNTARGCIFRKKKTRKKKKSKKELEESQENERMDVARRRSSCSSEAS
jgi:hypothetical protein